MYSPPNTYVLFSLANNFRLLSSYYFFFLFDVQNVEHVNYVRLKKSNEVYSLLPLEEIISIIL